MFARISGKGFPADEIGSRPHDIALKGVWVRDDRSIRGILYISVIKRAPYQNTGFGALVEKPNKLFVDTRLHIRGLPYGEHFEPDAGESDRLKKMILKKLMRTRFKGRRRRKMPTGTA